MKMSVYLQTATSHRGQRESRAIGQKLSPDDNYQYIRWLTRTIFFLRRWPRVWQPENSIKSHMVSYCSVIKSELLPARGHHCLCHILAQESQLHKGSFLAKSGT